MQINKISSNQNFGLRFSEQLETQLRNKLVSYYAGSLRSLHFKPYKNAILKLKRLAPGATLDVKRELEHSYKGDIFIKRRIFIKPAGEKFEYWVADRSASNGNDISVNDLEDITRCVEYYVKASAKPEYQQALQIANHIFKES